MNDFDYLKNGEVYLDAACQSLRPRPVIKALNESAGCVGKKVRLQKCDTNFKEKTESGQLLQSHLASLSFDEAKAELKSFLREFGATDSDLKEISKLEKSDEVKQILDKVKDIAKNQVKITGIPTLIYDGKKHLGLYEAK